MTVLPAIKRDCVVFVTLLLDDSDSIHEFGNVSAITRGANEFRRHIVERADGGMPTFLRFATFNGGDLGEGFVEDRSTSPLSDGDWFSPGHRTPLFAAARRALRHAEAAAHAYREEHGGKVLTITVIMTDGADNHSGTVTARRVKRRVEQMVATGQHMVVGCGVDDGQTNFREVFRSMGIPEHLVKVLKREDKDIEEGLTDLGGFTAGSTASHEAFTRSSTFGFDPNPSTP